MGGDFRQQWPSIARKAIRKTGSGCTTPEQNSAGRLALWGLYLARMPAGERGIDHDTPLSRHTDIAVGLNLGGDTLLQRHRCRITADGGGQPRIAVRLWKRECRSWPTSCGLDIVCQATAATAQQVTKTSIAVRLSARTGVPALVATECRRVISALPKTALTCRCELSRHWTIPQKAAVSEAERMAPCNFKTWPSSTASGHLHHPHRIPIAKCALKFLTTPKVFRHQGIPSRRGAHRRDSEQPQPRPAFRSVLKVRLAHLVGHEKAPTLATGLPVLDGRRQ